eukprot:tig00000670_g3026.t1
MLRIYCIAGVGELEEAALEAERMEREFTALLPADARARALRSRCIPKTEYDDYRRLEETLCSLAESLGETAKAFRMRARRAVETRQQVEQLQLQQKEARRRKQEEDQQRREEAKRRAEEEARPREEERRREQERRAELQRDKDRRREERRQAVEAERQSKAARGREEARRREQEEEQRREEERREEERLQAAEVERQREEARRREEAVRTKEQRRLEQLQQQQERRREQERRLAADQEQRRREELRQRKHGAHAVPCRFFAKGACREGAQCRYRHEAAAAGRGSFAAAPTDAHADPAAGSGRRRRQPAPCRLFAKGACRVGARCRYRHEAADGFEAAPAAAQQAPAECVICLEPLAAGPPAASALACRHRSEFHGACIEAWRAGPLADGCPLCGAPFAGPSRSSPTAGAAVGPPLDAGAGAGRARGGSGEPRGGLLRRLELERELSAGAAADPGAAAGPRDGRRPRLPSLRPARPAAGPPAAHAALPAPRHLFRLSEPTH